MSDARLAWTSRDAIRRALVDAELEVRLLRAQLRETRGRLPEHEPTMEASHG